MSSAKDTAQDLKGIRAKHIVKIKALLAKANAKIKDGASKAEADALQAEAVASMAKATELMEKHQIEKSELDLANEGYIEWGSQPITKAYSDAIQNIASNVAVLSGTVALMREAMPDGAMRAKSLQKIFFFGARSDVEFAALVYVYLLDVALSSSKIYVKPFDTAQKPLFRRSYILGFGVQIGIRVDHMMKDAQINSRRIAASTGTALMTMDNRGELARCALQNSGVNVQKAPDFKPGNLNQDAFYAGFNKAKEANLGLKPNA